MHWNLRKSIKYTRPARKIFIFLLFFVNSISAAMPGFYTTPWCCKSQPSANNKKVIACKCDKIQLYLLVISNLETVKKCKEPVFKMHFRNTPGFFQQVGGVRNHCRREKLTLFYFIIQLFKVET